MYKHLFGMIIPQTVAIPLEELTSVLNDSLKRDDRKEFSRFLLRSVNDLIA
jgi:hypothetical protein